ncbi:hypothetical protein G9A89_021708, partial [Geosiphon pyriformis]
MNVKLHGRTLKEDITFERMKQTTKVKFTKRAKSQEVVKSRNNLLDYSQTITIARDPTSDKIHCDNEFRPALDALSLEYDPLVVYYATANEHVLRAERNNRAIKERVRTTYHRLPYTALPRTMVKYIKYMKIWTLQNIVNSHLVNMYKPTMNPIHRIPMHRNLWIESSFVLPAINKGDMNSCIFRQIEWLESCKQILFDSAWTAGVEYELRENSELENNSVTSQDDDDTDEE